MAHFWEFLGPTFPKYGSILLKLEPELVLNNSKTLFKIFLKNSIFHRNTTFPKFVLFLVFAEFWPDFSPWRRPKLKKLNTEGQNYAIGLYEYCKIKALSRPKFSGKIRLLFVLFWLFFGKKKRSVVTCWKVRIKIWHSLFYQHDSWACFSQKILPHSFPVLRL